MLLRVANIFDTVFIIEGVLTIVAGVVAPFFLADCKCTYLKIGALARANNA